MDLVVHRNPNVVCTWHHRRSVITRKFDILNLVTETQVDSKLVFPMRESGRGPQGYWCSSTRLLFSSHLRSHFIDTISNMGIYTGMDLKKDDVVNFPEIVVPLLFREWGDHVEGYTDGTLW